MGAGIEPSDGADRGLTLIELLVVLALLAVLASLSAPAFSRLFPKYRLMSASDAVVSEIQRTRSRSIGTGEPTGFLVNTATGTFGGRDRRMQALPENIDVELVVAKQYLVEPRIGEIRFFADGTSSGGRVALISGPYRQEIRIDWFDGRIERSQ